VEADRDAALHAVSAAVLAVTRHLSVHEVFQVIVRAAAQLLDARYAALGVPDDAGSFAEFVVEGVSDEEWEAIGPLPRQHGLLAVMLREDKVQRLADVRKAPAFEGWPSAHPVLRDFLGVPIRDGEETLGIIFLANKRQAGGFTADDEERLILFAAHAAIALTNARLYERNRELTVIEERARLARELHDAVAQKLFSLRLTAAAALAAADPAPELERVQTLAKEALAELREVIFELRPAELAGDGLAESLRKHVRVLDRVWGAGRGRRTAVRFEGDEEVPLPPETEAVVFRIAQEALYNALRHGRPREVTVSLTPGALEIRDDGVGFDTANDSRDGLGLASMRDRAASVGGVLTIDSSRTGTVVRLEVPS
jgi:signal transduction histidine kinase